jgi:nicotinate phosphoribosyltransferase
MKPAQRSAAEGILFTDQYQLSMAHVYYRAGLHERRVQFDHFFREYPDYGAHQAGYCVNAGLEWLLDWMQEARFGDEEIEYLRGQTGKTGQRLFADDFLAWLRRNGTFDGLCLQAIPEGRVIHPNVPITVVQGPLAMAQILETALLNHLNYQILIATKAARIADSAQGRVVLEFGLRRAQEKGGNAGARAALIGGAHFTSNVGVSRTLGYPPKGTHAHSMVQVFTALGGSELDAFRQYAEVYPDDCLLLVDTIDTLESGVPNAIRVFEELRRKGHEPVGIRLDSGDLAYLSIQAARMLNDAGFPDTTIVLSSDLDELLIWQITTQIGHEAPRYGVDPEQLLGRLVYGVGTRLITSWGDPALGGVYKLVAVEDQGRWQPAIKVSDSALKMPNPGHKLAWRLYDRRGKASADLLSLEDEDPMQMEQVVLRHPADHTRQRILQREEIAEVEPLLIDVLLEGRLVTELPTIEVMRRRREADASRLDPGVRRLINPHVYHVSLTERLWSLKQELIASAMKSSAP